MMPEPLRRILCSGSLLALVLLAASGCAGTHPLNGEEESRLVLERLRERRDSIQSAVYRIRWRAVGTEPHAEFILEIAYKAPERFRIVATGPFGIPAFTAVVLGDDFTFINHRDGRYITDEVARLIEYEFPVAEFFEGPWRDLFAGGWGGSHEVESLTRRNGSNRFVAQSDDTDWLLEWNRGRHGPSRLSARVQAEAGDVVADVWFGSHKKDRLPFWELDRLVLKGGGNKGEHRWKLIKQDYNIPVPDRFFLPLREPAEWERPRK